jgi:hypothetical protein
LFLLVWWGLDSWLDMLVGELCRPGSVEGCRVKTRTNRLLCYGDCCCFSRCGPFFPVSTAVKYSLVAVVVIGAAIVWLFWRQKRHKKADDAWLACLPAENYQQPVMLVCGDGATPLFADSPLRQVPVGLYLHIADEEQLVSLTESLLSRRPAWSSQLCVARVVIPCQHQDAAVLAGQLQRFSRNLMQLRRRVGAKVPLISGVTRLHQQRKNLHRG